MTSFRIPPSALIFLSGLAIFTIIVSALSEGMGGGVISTSFIKTIGKTLCLCLAAIAMDLVWGYCGILSLGHFAFFGLGGYMIGMWLMYARTETIVATSMAQAEIPPTPQEVIEGIGTQIFGVVGSSEFPMIWAVADSLFFTACFGGGPARRFGLFVWMVGVPVAGNGRLSVNSDPSFHFGAVIIPFSK